MSSFILYIDLIVGVYVSSIEGWMLLVVCFSRHVVAYFCLILTSVFNLKMLNSNFNKEKKKKNTSDRHIVAMIHFFY